jgi:peptidoglycan/xylan/chitin deacetylase (PgdA/CDA1 family)
LKRHVGWLLILTISSFTSCKQKAREQGGISISFDDRSITAWYNLKDVLLKYEVKASFFVTQFDSLDSAEIAMLKLLESDGHEIASHGALHVISEDYIREHSYSDYLQNEIDASISAMKKEGFHPESFAYPYGAKYWFTDFLLLERFKIVRGVERVNGDEVQSNDEIFYSFDDKQTVSAASIDRNSGLDSAMVRHLLHRAEQNNEVVLLYGHAPSTQDNSSAYTFDVELLEFIFSEARKNNLKFYRMRDLAD